LHLLHLLYVLLHLRLHLLLPWCWRWR
jgi:hypothetical protein